MINFFFLLANCDCWCSWSRSPSRGTLGYPTASVLIQSISRQTCRGSNLIAQKTGSYVTSSSVKTFEVCFSQVISIRAGVTYTATARRATSTTSYSFDDGMASASCSCLSNLQDFLKILKWFLPVRRLNTSLNFPFLPVLKRK